MTEEGGMNTALFFVDMRIAHQTQLLIFIR